MIKVRIINAFIIIAISTMVIGCASSSPVNNLKKIMEKKEAEDFLVKVDGRLCFMGYDTIELKVFVYDTIPHPEMKITGKNYIIDDSTGRIFESNVYEDFSKFSGFIFKISDPKDANSSMAVFVSKKIIEEKMVPMTPCPFGVPMKITGAVFKNRINNEYIIIVYYINYYP